jgi:hypothetical protein
VLGVAVATYAIAIAFSDDRPARRSAVGFLAAQALLAVLIASPVVLARPALAIWLAALAGVFSWLGARRYAPVILAHGAVFAVAAAAVSGLPRVMVASWLRPLDTWPVWPVTAWIVGGAAMLGVLGPRLAAGGAEARLTAAARAVLAVVSAAVAGTWAIGWVGQIVIPSPGPGAVATLRSVVLASLALTLAVCGRVTRGRALGRLAPLVIGLGGVKFVAEDIWRASPVQLFVSLAGYGLVLVVGLAQQERQPRAQVVRPQDQRQRALQEAEVQEPNREQPGSEPQKAD